MFTKCKDFFWGSGSIVLLVYFFVDVLLLLTNPPQYVRDTVDFLGEPVDDLSDEIRIFLTENTQSQSKVTWEVDESNLCRFSYGWARESGLLGGHRDIDLCNVNLEVDYYAVEGVTVLSPYGSEVKCPTLDEIKDDEESFFNVDTDRPYMVKVLDHDIYNIFMFCYFDEEFGFGGIEMGNDPENREEWIDNRRSLDFHELRHIHTFEVELSVLGLPEDASVLDAQSLFVVSKIFGAYEIADNTISCEINVGTVECGYSFRFFTVDNMEVNVVNSTIGVRSDILEEVNGIVNGTISITPELPDHLSTQGMVEGIEKQLSSEGKLEEFDIDCTASYPYPSSICFGTYELAELGFIKYNERMISVMTVFVVLWCLMLYFLRMGMLNDRSSRGYLGPGGSCQYFFEDAYNNLNKANPIPSIVLLRVCKGEVIEESHDEEFCAWEQQPSSSVPRENPIPRTKVKPESSLSSCAGIIVSHGEDKIPIEALRIPVCFVVRENENGSITNLDMEEVHRLIDNDCGNVLEDESFGGDHLLWARGFSLADAGGCLVTLWTVHLLAINSGWGSFYWVAALVAIGKWLEESDIVSFVSLFCSRVSSLPKNRHSSVPPLPITLAVMEVMYDLDLPGVQIIGLIFTVLWTIFILVSCVYFVFVLGYEPIYEGGGCFSKKLSLATAVSVCTTMKTPLALSGDWVRRTRGGDIGERLAFPLCLGIPAKSNGSRVSHVNHQSEKHPQSLAGSVVCG